MACRSLTNRNEACDADRFPFTTLFRRVKDRVTESALPSLFSRHYFLHALLPSTSSAMSWSTFSEWFLSLGAEYGVDPVIFGALNLGAIPFFWLSVVWFVRNQRRGKPVVLPVLATGACVLSSYLYLFVAGENLPTWVYAIAASLLGYSLYSAIATLRNRAVEAPHEDDVGTLHKHASDTKPK